jgi:hypothetical protein
MHMRKAVLRSWIAKNLKGVETIQPKKALITQDIKELVQQRCPKGRCQELSDQKAFPRQGRTKADAEATVAVSLGRLREVTEPWDVLLTSPAAPFFVFFGCFDATFPFVFPLSVSLAAPFGFTDSATAAASFALALDFFFAFADLGSFASCGGCSGSCVAGADAGARISGAAGTCMSKDLHTHWPITQAVSMHANHLLDKNN